MERGGSLMSRAVRTAEPMRRQGVIRFEMPEDTLPPDPPSKEHNGAWGLLWMSA